MPGDNQHFIPASLIGRFSAEQGGRARNRKLWVRRRSSNPFQNAADKLANANAIYGTGEATDDLRKSIDYIWSI